MRWQQTAAFVAGLVSTAATTRAVQFEFSVRHECAVSRARALLICHCARFYRYSHAAEGNVSIQEVFDSRSLSTHFSCCVTARWLVRAPCRAPFRYVAVRVIAAAASASAAASSRRWLELCWTNRQLLPADGSTPTSDAFDEALMDSKREWNYQWTPSKEREIERDNGESGRKREREVWINDHCSIPSPRKQCLPVLFERRSRRGRILCIGWWLTIKNIRGSARDKIIEIVFWGNL